MANEVKKLYRSRTDRMIAGVCGGLGEYLNVDPTLIRLIFVFAALLGGPGIIIYIVWLLVVPEEPLPNEAIITTGIEAAPEEENVESTE
jgi:phage shock protein C